MWPDDPLIFQKNRIVTVGETDQRLIEHRPAARIRERVVGTVADEILDGPVNKQGGVARERPRFRFACVQLGLPAYFLLAALAAGRLAVVSGAFMMRHSSAFISV